MRTALAMFLLCGVGCGEALEKLPPTDPDAFERNANSNPPPGQTGSGTTDRTPIGLASDPDNCRPAGGLAQASLPVVDLPEVHCSVIRDQTGFIRQLVAVFGEFDPAEQTLEDAEPLLLLETPMSSWFYPQDQQSDYGFARLRWNGELRQGWGDVRWEADGVRGVFDATDAALPTHLSFAFDCQSIDPPELTGPALAPIPAPGTAYVTNFLGQVAYLDDIACDDRLSIVRTAQNACDAASLELRPFGSQRIVGPATYPDYFAASSAWTVNFRSRAHETAQAGTLELLDDNPRRGFITFPVGSGLHDRVDFTCPD